MHTKIFHANNSAVYIENSGKKILVDGMFGGTFHSGETMEDVGMSNMPEAYAEMMQKDEGIFKNLDWLLFTHCHHDHYEKASVEAYRQRHPAVQYFGFGVGENTAEPESLGESISFIADDPVKIYALKTEHLDLGKRLSQFRDVTHCCFLLDFGTETILIAGDGVLNEALYNELERQRLEKIDYAFVNVAHLLTKDNAAFIKKVEPETIVLYHLPNPDDDRLNYWSLMEQAKKIYSSGSATLIVAPHMAWIEF